MKIKLVLLLFIMIACSGNPQEEFHNLHPELAQKMNSKISSIYEDYNIYGDFLLGVVNENGLVYSLAMNRNILAGKPATLDINSPIYVASHTKAFTGTLLKILEEDGQVDLNKSMHDHLPEITFDGSIDTKAITVRHMLNHTLGFTSNPLVWKTAFLGYSNGNSELIDDINSSYRYDPSHQFRYSNTGPIIAAMVAEKVTGNSWKKEMKQRIFLPLKMNNTSANVSDFKLEEIRPSIQMRNENEVFSSGFYKQDITMSAAGGTISTVNDLSKWLQFNINRETSIIKNKRSFDELHGQTVQQNRTYFTYKRHGYSLGWDIATYQADTVLTRFGTYGGISFHLSFMPARKVGIVAFSDEDGLHRLPHLMANYAYNLLIQKPNVEDIFNSEKEQFVELYERNKKDPLPAEDMLFKDSQENDKLVGRYKNDKNWPEIIITNKEKSYEFKWGVLAGPIYKSADANRPYQASLGPLMRTFAVHKNNGFVDSLFTGSLKYFKAN